MRMESIKIGSFNLKKLRYILPLVLFFFTFACGDKQQSEAKKESTATAGSVPKAYRFNLVTLDGKSVTLDDYQGKALILDIWDTWCPPCKKEIPDFIKLYSEYNSKGLEILGVAVGRDGIEAVRSFVKQNGVNYPNAIMTEDFLPGVGQIRGIPTTFVIDKNGGIYKKYIGFKEKSVFEQDIREILDL
ncbi:TlpA family protein disulfide reductase [candidate division KSB1 bacterium]|nr:TlpA family protein disulfide reductase [candidate division KSB1 bacterium]